MRLGNPKEIESDKGERFNSTTDAATQLKVNRRSLCHAIRTKKSFYLMFWQDLVRGFRMIITWRNRDRFNL